MTAITNIPDLLAISQNSLIGSILQILVQQDFAPIKATAPEEGDKKIGELTALEKAIYTAHLRMTIGAAAEKSKLAPGQDSQPDAHQKIRFLNSELRNLHDLFWNSIRYRFTCLGITDFRKLQIRSDGSVIIVPQDEDAGSSSGTLVIRISI